MVKYCSNIKIRENRCVRDYKVVVNQFDRFLEHTTQQTIVHILPIDYSLFYHTNKVDLVKYVKKKSIIC